MSSKVVNRRSEVVYKDSEEVTIDTLADEHPLHRDI